MRESEWQSRVVEWKYLGIGRLLQKVRLGRLGNLRLARSDGVARGATLSVPFHKMTQLVHSAGRQPLYMVYAVGREYNRRLSADDARDALCQASHHQSPPSLAAAARLDDWILNGSGSVSAPGYPAELFSNASAAAPSNRGSPSVERVVVSNAEVDNLIRGLAAARHAVSAEEFHRFVANNDAVLSKLLRPFGYQGCRLTAQASIDDFDRAYSAWSARNAEEIDARPSVGLPPEQGSVEEDAAARQQMWRAAATDPIAAAFVGAGAVVSATVGRLFGFEQDPHRAAAGGQMTSILVHTAGGAGASRAMGSALPPMKTEGPVPAGWMAVLACLSAAEGSMGMKWPVATCSPSMLANHGARWRRDWLPSLAWTKFLRS